MSDQLNLDNLKEIREELTKIIKVVSTEAGKARDGGKIDERQWQQAKDKWGELETQELELQGLIDKLELDFIRNSDVYEQILDSTKKLNKATQKIDNFGNFLSEIANVASIVASTIKAIQPREFLTFPT